MSVFYQALIPVVYTFLIFIFLGWSFSASWKWWLFCTVSSFAGYWLVKLAAAPVEWAFSDNLPDMYRMLIFVGVGLGAIVHLMYSLAIGRFASDA